MTEKEAKKKGFFIENYGGGFIITHYSKDDRVRYCSKDMDWRRQPVLHPPFFSTKEEALEACDKA